ncbi:hypothetical protein G3N64_31370 [Burkholderia sp. Ac-20344]|nr:hypothetical protein [Burkholderia sp. Ac-20344]
MTHASRSLRVGFLVAFAMFHVMPTHAACSLSFSNVDVDYGRLTRAALTGPRLAPAIVSLDIRQVTVNVVCDEPGAMRVRLFGAGTGGQFQFGAGGQTEMRFENAQLDGRPVMLGRAIGGGVPKAVGPRVTVGPNQELVPVEQGLPASGKRFAVQAVLNTTLTDKATRVTQPTTLKANIEFQAYAVF